MRTEGYKTNNKLTNTWRICLQKTGFFRGFLFSVAGLAAALAAFSVFLGYVESRHGFSFADPMLSIFTPVDVTWLCFTAIYGGLVLGLVTLANNPEALVTALRAYTIMLLFRMGAMSLLPLEPPESIIILRDPLVEFFGTGQVMTKDLFFSGHTATSFILYLTAENRIIKTVFMVLTVCIGLFVLLQHVHYSIDVLSAPFFAYASYRLAIIKNKSPEE